MYDAYARIFQRCGLKTIAVEADTGVIGGKYSHEFMVPAETGENEVAYCEKGDYAANVEKASSGLPAPKILQRGELEKFATPGVQTIEDLAKPPFNVPGGSQIKTLVYLVESKPILVLLRGEDQLNEAKLAGAIGTTLFRAATADEIFGALGAHPGSLGLAELLHECTSWDAVGTR
jgi:prolyl-tRNA synthetase